MRKTAGGYDDGGSPRGEHGEGRRPGHPPGSGGPSGARRAASLDSLAAAQQRFDRLLTALADTFGGAGAGSPPTGSPRGKGRAPADRGLAGGAAGLNGGGSVLAFPAELFRAALRSARGAVAAAGAGGAPAGPAARPPVPLFC